MFGIYLALLQDGDVSGVVMFSSTHLTSLMNLFIYFEANPTFRAGFSV